MEDVDAAICQLLAADGRMSFTELGKQHRSVHLGGTPAGQAARAARRDPGLRRQHRLRGVRPAADGVHLDPADRPVAARRLADAARGHPEIEACHSVAGDESYILKVRVAEPSASRTCWPGSGRRRTSRRGRRSCCPRRTRTVRPASDAYCTLSRRSMCARGAGALTGKDRLRPVEATVAPGRADICAHSRRHLCPVGPTFAPGRGDGQATGRAFCDSAASRLALAATSAAARWSPACARHHSCPTSGRVWIGS